MPLQRTWGAQGTPRSLEGTGHCSHAQGQPGWVLLTLSLPGLPAQPTNVRWGQWLPRHAQGYGLLTPTRATMATAKATPQVPPAPPDSTGPLKMSGGALPTPTEAKKREQGSSQQT